MKSCGKCKNFIKIKSLVGNSGSCVKFDCRTNSDYGHNCVKFKSIKFEQIKNNSLLMPKAMI